MRADPVPSPETTGTGETSMYEAAAHAVTVEAARRQFMGEPFGANDVARIAVDAALSAAPSPPGTRTDAERDVITVLRECVGRGHGPMLTPEEAAALLAMVERRASLLPPYEHAVKLDLPETAAVERDTSLVNLKPGDRVRQHIMGYGGREVHVYEIVRGYEFELAAKRAQALAERAP